MANRVAKNTPVSPVVMVVVVIILVAIAGLIGWKTVGAGGGQPPPIHVDMEKVKSDVKLHGFGHHGQ